MHEVFHSIQGESTHAGRPCFFIRLTGCHLRCVWCDTEHAFFDGEVWTVSGCVDAAVASGARLVEVTGGEPLLQKAVYPLLERLADRGLEVLLETSGALSIAAVDPRVRRIVDWKCPGSAMAARNEPRVIGELRPGDELKLVLQDRRDYEWAREWLGSERARIPEGVPVHFSPAFDVHPQGRPEESPPGDASRAVSSPAREAAGLAPRSLARWILEDGLDVRLGLQLHKVIWDPGTRGV